MALSEGVRALALAAVAIAATLAWMAVHALRLPSASPERLVAELRLAQTAALALAFGAGSYWGFAAGTHAPGAGLDVALALGFLVVAAVATTRDPRVALTSLALAFATHALIDIAHRPGLLPPDLVPRWYTIACAVDDLVLGAICYVPLLRR